MILAIDQLLIQVVECQREYYLRKVESHLEETQRVDQLNRIAKARGSTMICSYHAKRGRGSFGWRIFSGAKSTQQRGKETHRGGNAEGKEGDTEPGRAHACPMRKFEFAEGAGVFQPRELESALEGNQFPTKVTHCLKGRRRPKQGQRRSSRGVVGSDAGSARTCSVK